MLSGAKEVFMEKEVLQKIEEIVSPVLSRMGYELIDVEWVFEGAQILRIYIDKQGGITIDDCESVSRVIEDNLDVEDLIHSKYSLEISSPGLDRPLKKQKEFEKFQGRQVKVKTTEPIEGRSNYKGDLIKVEKDQIGILIDGMVYKVPFNKILKARLVPDVTELKWNKRK